MGYLAAKLLHQILEGHLTEQLPRILVPPVKIIERRSTDFHSFSDLTVVQAMHYIYYNACKGIKTEQVLDAVNMSRSNLEQRFKKEVGKTIHAVIYEEKLKRAKNLLATTTLSIQEISVMVYSNRLIIKRSRVQESNTRDNQSIKPSILLLWLKIINYNPYYRERNPDFYFL